jgi:hypothetical protein
MNYSPKRSQLLLPSYIPNCEHHILVLDLQPHTATAAWECELGRADILLVRLMLVDNGPCFYNCCCWLLLSASGQQEHYCICPLKTDTLNQLLLSPLLLLLLLLPLLLLMSLLTHLFYIEANGGNCRQHLCSKHTQSSTAMSTEPGPCCATVQSPSATVQHALSQCPAIPQH